MCNTLSEHTAKYRSFYAAGVFPSGNHGPIIVPVVSCRFYSTASIKNKMVYGSDLLMGRHVQQRDVKNWSRGLVHKNTAKI